MISALIGFIIANFWTVLAGAGAAFLAIFGAWMRHLGKKAADAKHAQRDAKARDIADEIDDAVAGRDPVSNRGRLKSWKR